MVERIAHDHPTVETRSATIERRGRTTRPEIRIAGDLDVEPGSLIRLVLDGHEYRAPIEKRDDGTPVIRHAAETPRLARNRSAGENALVEWVEASGLEIGRSVEFDIVEPGYRYGLRKPGERATYESGRPEDSLSSIAENLDG
ncbi:MAG: DUF7112 family protein [Halobacteriota archaeon]